MSKSIRRGNYKEQLIEYGIENCENEIREKIFLFIENLINENQQYYYQL